MAELFASYCTALEPRKQPYAREKWSVIGAFWRTRLLSTVGTDRFKEFSGWRRRKAIKNHTLDQDVVVIRPNDGAVRQIHGICDDSRECPSLSGEIPRYLG